MRYIFLRPLQAVKNIMLLEGSHVKTSGYAVWVHIMIIIIVIAFIIIMSITKLCHSVTLFIMKKNTTIHLLEAFSPAVHILTTCQLTIIKMNEIYLILYILMAVIVFCIWIRNAFLYISLKALIDMIYDLKSKIY